VDASLRRPTELDHAAIVDVVDHWFGGRRVLALVGRAWFRHFAATSWVAPDDRGRPRAFLLGFVSPDRPGEAVIHLLAVDPRHRRRGLGRSMVEAFAVDATSRGCRLMTAVAWPDDPPSIGFFRALGFDSETGPATQRLYGVASYPAYDGPGEDRTVLTRAIG
jgi:ribosomal protein S18 acetylase RimI-like enzyme